MRPRQLIAVLALAGTFVALYLTLYKIGVIGELSCSIGECETVNTSRWATFLRLPVAAWGLGAYLTLFVLALAGLREGLGRSLPLSRALAAISGASFLFSAWLTYLELFVIRAICIWCIASASLISSIFVAAIVDLRATARSTRAGPRISGEE